MVDGGPRLALPRLACLPGLTGRAIVLPVHDEYRPAAFGEQRAEPLREVRVASDAQDEHLPGQLAELARQLVGYIPKTQLGSHLETVHCLRLGSRVEQGTHAMRPLRRRCLLRQDPGVERLRGD